jgi:hypothetical protein
MRFLFSACLILVVASCGHHYPGEQVVADSVGGSRGRLLVEQSVEAHGGNAYTKFRDINVSYDGEWARLVRRIQPDIVDHRFRGRSQERLLLRGGGAHAQHYVGEDGLKTVVRGRRSISVRYNGEPAESEGTRQASAMVSDAYEMFLLGPSFLLKRGTSFERLPEVEEAGRSYERVSITLRPGLGFASTDRCDAWIDSATKQLFRVHFTLEGVDAAAGGHVDTTFRNYFERDGHWWPAQFEERLRGPIPLPVHRWWMTGLDTDRGYSREAITGSNLSGAAARDASPASLPSAP